MINFPINLTCTNAHKFSHLIVMWCTHGTSVHTQSEFSDSNDLVLIVLNKWDQLWEVPLGIVGFEFFTASRMAPHCCIQAVCHTTHTLLHIGGLSHNTYTVAYRRSATQHALSYTANLSHNTHCRIQAVCTQHTHCCIWLNVNAVYCIVRSLRVYTRLSSRKFKHLNACMTRAKGFLPFVRAKSRAFWLSSRLPPVTIICNTQRSNAYIRLRT